MSFMSPALGGRFFTTKVTWEPKMKELVTQLIQLLETPWTGVHSAPLSMGFARQEHWAELPFPSPGYLPDPGIEPASPAWQAILYH